MKAIAIAFIVLAALAFDAQASDTHPTQGDANQHCQSVVQQDVNAYCANFQPGSYQPRTVENVVCELQASYKRYQEKGKCMGMNGSLKIQVSTYEAVNLNYHNWTTDCQIDQATGGCYVQCSARPTSHSMDGVEGGSTYCESGCTYQASGITGTGAAPTGATCESNSTACPSGYVKITGGSYAGACAPDLDGDGVSNGNDAYPSDGSNGADGSKAPDPALDPSQCGGAGQPPCTKPGDESDNKASGGAGCDVPPTCSGDGIACNIDFQTWKGRCAAEGQKALLEAANAKLEAMKNYAAAQATASKQDDIKAAIDLSRAQITQYQVNQLVEQQLTNARLYEQKLAQADEVASTNNAIQTFSDRMKAEQDETQARVDALKDKYAQEVTATNDKLEALKGFAQSSLDAGSAAQQTRMETAAFIQSLLSATQEELIKSDRRDNKIDTSNSHLAAIKDAQAVAKDVAHADAAEQSGKLTEMLAKLQSLIDKPTGSGGSTDMTATNAKLDAIKGAIEGQDANSNSVGNSFLAGIKGTLDTIKGWFDPSQLTPDDLNPGLGEQPGDAEWVKDGGTLDASGLDFSGFGGGGSTCPALAVPASGGAYFSGFLAPLASPPAAWCDFIANVKVILIVLASITGIVMQFGGKRG